MNGINPINGPRPAGADGLSGSRQARPSAGDSAARLSSPKSGEGFARAVGQFVENVDAGQHRSAEAIQDLVSGRTRDVVGVVADVAQADLSFKLLIGVRNQIIEAYKQTMNMQI